MPNDLTSPSKEGRLSLLANITSSTPDAWEHLTSLPTGSVNRLIPEEKISVQEKEIVDYGSQLAELTTSRCTVACRPLQESLTSSNSGQCLSALFGFGKYVVTKGGVKTSQQIGVATLNPTLPLAFHEYAHSAIAELFAVFYMQWNERTDFTTPKLRDLGRAAKAFFETVQLHIPKLESSARKEVGKRILNCLDIENVAYFVRAKGFNWVINKTQDPWKGMDWQRRSDDTLCQVQTGNCLETKAEILCLSKTKTTHVV
jgi:hypothetical protein